MKHHTELRQYLFKSWYARDKLVLWGRREKRSRVPFDRKNTFFEDNSYVLKRNVLIFHDRTRVNSASYILDQSLVPKFQADIELLQEGLKKPHWWRDITKE